MNSKWQSGGISVPIEIMKKPATKPQKVEVLKATKHEYQHIVDELSRLRTRHMILEDNMDKAVSEVRNSVAFVINELHMMKDKQPLENSWTKSIYRSWASPSQTWLSIKNQIKIAIFDNVISKFKH